MKFLMFDFDGVIVSTFSLAYEVINAIQSHALTEEEYRASFDGNSFQKFGPELGGTGDRVTDRTPFFQRYGPELLKKKPIPGIAELLRELKDDGFTMVIISSTMDDIIDEFLKEHSIRGCFTAIYGATYHKDKVFKIERALEDIQVKPSDARFITDTLGDLHDAAEANVPAIGVTWGYHDRKTLEQGHPRSIVETIDELREVITKTPG